MLSARRYTGAPRREAGSRCSLLLLGRSPNCETDIEKRILVLFVSLSFSPFSPICFFVVKCVFKCMCGTVTLCHFIQSADRSQSISISPVSVHIEAPRFRRCSRGRLWLRAIGFGGLGPDTVLAALRLLELGVLGTLRELERHDWPAHREDF